MPAGSELTDLDSISHSNEVDTNWCVQELYLEAPQLPYFPMSLTFVNDVHG
jgi:hypothetical protein